MTEKTDTTLWDLFSDADPSFPAEVAQSLLPEVNRQLSKEWPEVQWKSLENTIAGKTLELLAIPVVGKILVPAWLKYRDLREAEKSDDPEGQYVWLAQHTVTSTHHPQLEVRCNGVAQRPIILTVVVELTLDGFGLLIRAGKIRSIDTSAIEGQGSVKLGPVEIKKELPAIHLLKEISLGEGIPLHI